MEVYIIVQTIIKEVTEPGTVFMIKRKLTSTSITEVPLGLNVMKL